LLEATKVKFYGLGLITGVKNGNVQVGQILELAKSIGAMIRSFSCPAKLARGVSIRILHFG
jgi:hypothetical protein